MKRIVRRVLAVTPNPALDLGGVVDVLRPDEKSYVHDETRAPGGNGINAARILTRLGVPAVAAGFIGGGTGQEITRLLTEEGVEQDFVAIDAPSRIGVTVSNRADHRQTRLSFPGPRIRRRETDALVAKLRHDRFLSQLLIGGSFPAGFGLPEARRLIRLARQRGVPVTVDCPAAVLPGLIEAGPFFIKPNLTEFQQSFHSKAESIDDVVADVRRLLPRVPYVCVSSVEGGALLVAPDGVFFGRIPRVKLRSTVGAGDSMVGAMVSRFHRGRFGGEDLLRWGLAAAASTLEQPGTTLGAARDIRRLYRRTAVRTVDKTGFTAAAFSAGMVEGARFASASSEDHERRSINRTS